MEKFRVKIWRDLRYIELAEKKTKDGERAQENDENIGEER